MSPYPIVAPPHEEEGLAEQVEKAVAASPVAAKVNVPEARRSREMFADTLLEMSAAPPRQRMLDFFVSFTIHFLFLSLMVLIPLYYTDTLDLKAFSRTMLVAPPPPPPPPPPAAPTVAKMIRAPKRAFVVEGRLIAPTVIPEKVAMLKEEPLPPDVGLGVGVAGGIPGGVPGGQIGGVIGGIISEASRTPVMPKAPPAVTAPIRVGGRIRAPRAVVAPQPIYPPLAKQAKIWGDVNIDAVIDAQGNVVEMQLVSGHALLVQAAMDALRQWKYEPTYLNDQPVPVRLVVTVKFRLE
jgi:protein TonB